MPDDDGLDIPLASIDGELSDQDLQMIKLGEGETLEEIKARLTPKKTSIPLDMLDSANSYDDKVRVATYVGRRRPRSRSKQYQTPY